jgi:hypothetical protein
VAAHNVRKRRYFDDFMIFAEPTLRPIQPCGVACNMPATYRSHIDEQAFMRIYLKNRRYAKKYAINNNLVSKYLHFYLT